MNVSVRKSLAAAMAAVALSGCDALLVPPATAPTALAVSYSLASNPARAFDKADNAVVSVALGTQELVRKTFNFPAGQEEIRVRIELDVPDEQATAAVTLELRAGSQTLFTGAQTVVLEQGEQHEAAVSLTPIAVQIALPSEFTVTSLGQVVQLTGFALFATGDTIGVANIAWSTTAPELQLTADGRLTASQNGTYSVTATSGTFSKTAEVRVVAPAAAVAFTSTVSASVFPGDTVIPPAVRVTDASGTGLRGVVVAFSADNGGSVRTTNVTTNAQGLAQSPVWQIGKTGPNTLTATVAGVAPSAVSVTPLDPCTREPLLSANSVTTGQLVVGVDCQPSAGGRVSDRYRFSLATASVFRATLQSNDFGPFVVTGVPGTPSGFQIGGRSSSTGQTTVEHVLPAGAYFVNATTQASNVGGAYTLTLSTGDEPQPDCGSRTGDAAVTWGSAANGRLTTADCVDEFDPDTTLTRRLDGYTILLRAGESVTATVTADFPYRFARWIGSSFQAIHENVQAGESRSFTVTSTASAFHGFYIITQHENGTGNYTITFSEGAASQNASEPARTQSTRTKN